MQWTIPVRIIPGSKKNSMEQHMGRLKVKLTAPAVDGKANAALIQCVARQFGLRKSAVSIVSGEKSRNKILEVTADTSPDICRTITGNDNYTGRKL